MDTAPQKTVEVLGRSGRLYAFSLVERSGAFFLPSNYVYVVFPNSGAAPSVLFAGDTAAHMDEVAFAQAVVSQTTPVFAFFLPTPNQAERAAITADIRDALL